MINICPVCDEGKLASGSRMENSEYKGTKYFVKYEYSECGACGADIVLPEQAKANKFRIQDEHKKIMGLLTSNEIKQFRDRLGLTQSLAAELLGGGPNSFSKYERGEVTQSGAMDRLIRLVSSSTSAFNELQRVAGISLVKENKTIFIDYSKATQTNEINETLVLPLNHLTAVKSRKREGSFAPIKWENTNNFLKEIING